MDPYLQGSTFGDNEKTMHTFAAAVRIGYYGQGRQVRSSTVSTALSAVNKTISMATNRNPFKVEGCKSFIPKLQQTLDGWERDDPPIEKKMPVEVDVPEFLVRCGLQPGAKESVKALGDVTLIMFYFLLRIGEMTMKSLRASQMDKRTIQFRQEDVTFFWEDKVTGKLTQIPRNAPDWMILGEDAATMKLDNQKNGWKGVCISHHSNGEGEFDPVKALARRYVHIRAHTADQSTYLSAVFEDGVRTDVLAKDVSAGLKMAAAALDYPASRGIPIDRIDTHSLRIGGANALSLAGYSNRQIQKMGRWRGETFMEYIRESLSDFSEGMSNAMKKNFGFVSLEGGAYHDVTTTVMAADYNEAISAGAA
jgi:hypothetical protein